MERKALERTRKKKANIKMYRSKETLSQALQKQKKEIT